MAMACSPPSPLRRPRGVLAADIGRLFGSEMAPRFCDPACSSVRPIASRGVEPIAGLVGKPRELVPGERPPPASADRIERVHHRSAESEPNEEREISVHEEN